jgi:gamma-glutamyltranspeptidase / glutathione hydrolase
MKSPLPPVLVGTPGWARAARRDRPRTANAPRAARALVVGLLAVAAGCQTTPWPQQAPAPSAAPPSSAGPGGAAEHAMVASAHPLASEAGVAMLRAGGNAIDAAVATAFAVGVVEPMMGGIGGSGGMLIWRQEAGRADYLDFYARAPGHLPPDAAERRRDHPARLVAVPGAVAGLLEAHGRFGRLDRAAILEPAIRLAEDGFPVSGLLARTIADDSAKLTAYDRARELFWPGYRPLAAGERLVQPELAETLRRIAREGQAGFHQGPVAAEVVSVLRAGGNPITLKDLAGFEPVWRRPVCGVYRGRPVLSAPPPQSGLQLVQTLHLLEAYDLGALGPPPRSTGGADALVRALRIATADRQHHMADPDHVRVPAAGITSPAYARERAAAAGAGRDVAQRVSAGDPLPFDHGPPPPACAPLDPFGPTAAHDDAAPGAAPAALAIEDDRDQGETTHLSVVDAEGNAVSLTFTQGAYFGSGAWAAGTFLNNAMSIFSGDPDSPNYLRPGRAPVSTTTPTIILDGDRVRMVVGSPGGGRIPHAVVQAIVYTLDYGLSPLEALRMPRVHPHFSTPTIDFEQGFRGDVLGGLRERGYQLEVMPPTSLYFGGVHLIVRRDGRWLGAADPRRDGEVRGF